MIAHLKYARYMLLHKWHVFVECCRLGVPLLGIVHDLSKLLPWEWAPYAEYFYAPLPSIKQVYGDQRNLFSRYREDQERDFDYAWNYHQKANKHHWQWWILREDEGKRKALPMPDCYRREMLADWRGASRVTRNKDDVKTWYLKNRAAMLLHPETQTWVEKQLPRFGPKRVGVDFGELTS